MKLTPEEINYLRKEIRRLRESQEGFYEYMKSREIKASTGPEMMAIGDVLTEDDYGRSFANYRSLYETLSTSDYVTTPTTDKIDIGTKFVVTYDTIDDEDLIILTEGGYGTLPDDLIVSIDSPLGKVILGKKEGESFEFTLGNDIRMSLSKRTISGKIKEIKTDPNDYLHFIRDKKYSWRVSRKNKNLFTELAKTDTEEAKTVLESWQEISPSQKELLAIEIKRLSKKKKTPQVTSRLAYITELYKKSTIAAPPTDEKIGVGTRFELMTTDGETITTNEYEMINRAVSDELENEYIERISPLGEKIFGLKQNDEFEFVQNRKTYKGIITRVEPPEKNTTLTYKYIK